MESLPPYTIFPLGDSALVVDFGNVIDGSLNWIVHSLFHQLKKEPIEGIMETVPGYSSLTVYYDIVSVKQNSGEQTAFQRMGEKIRNSLRQQKESMETTTALLRVPVCYEKEYAPDLEFISRRNDISIEEIIRLHSSAVYTVYMLGFLPGFAYMAEVDERIACPRKSQPVMVEAGSVGIAGKQTGIYPLRSPGGWQVIGRTPVKLFDKKKTEPTFFKPADRVEFYSITNDEFINWSAPEK